MPLPNNQCDMLTHKGSTNGLGKLATVTAMVAMIDVLGSPVRVRRPSVLIPRQVHRHRDRAPNLTKINNMMYRMKHTTERTLDEPTQAFPTDAKETERERERRLNERSSKKKGKSIRQRRGRRSSRTTSMIVATTYHPYKMSLSLDWPIRTYCTKCSY